VIGEHNAEIDAAKVKRVIACSGKVYYDLVKKRDEKKSHDVAIIRVEQLYPFPHKAFAAELKKYPNATDIVWCQDEPQNQGAWFFVQHHIHENMLEGQKLGYAGRPASASPAVGYAHLHQEQQKALLEGLRQAQGLRADQVSNALTVALARAPEPCRTHQRIPHHGNRRSQGSPAVRIRGRSHLLQWKKKAGEAVAIDEILIEIETDKVVLEVPAPPLACSPRSWPTAAPWSATR
jgi:hypothetical protein